MASRADLEAGRAFVRLFLKNDFSSQLTRALQSAGAGLKSFGRGVMARGALITGAGAAILAPLTAAVKSFASQGDMLDKMSLRTGIAVGSLAELGFAAEQSGTSLEAVAATVLKMNRRFGRVTAGAGTANQISALEELGLTVDQLRSMDAEGRFLAIGDAVAKYGDNAAAAGLAQRVFGTGIDAVIPLLIQGKEGIAALRAEARDLGIVPTEEEVANAAKVTDALNRVRRVVKSMIFDVGAALAEPALRFMETAKRVAVGVKAWIKNNADLIRTAAKIGAVLVVAGGIVTAFGAAIFAAGIVLTALGTTVAFLGTAIAFLASPIGIAVAVIVGLVAAVVGAGLAWVRFSKTGQQAWASLKATVMPIVETLKTAFGGIKDAIASGDWKLAGKIAMAGLKLAFLQGLSAIQTAFPKTFNTIFSIVGKIMDGLVTMFGKAMGVLKGQWNAWGKSVLNTVISVAGGVVGTWQKAVEGMANWMLETSAKGGVMGKAMSKILGVDMAEEQARSDRLDKALGLGPTDVLAEAQADVNRITEQWEAQLRAGLADAAESADAFMQNLPEGLTSDIQGSLDRFIQSLESGEAVGDAAKELAALRQEAAERAKAEGAAAGRAAGSGPAIAAALAAPRGVALTATYSAAAARISGFQPGIAGPEEKMAAGIDGVNDNTKQMLAKLDLMAKWFSQNVNLQAVFERFLAGWKVT